MTNAQDQDLEERLNWEAAVKEQQDQREVEWAIVKHLQPTKLHSEDQFAREEHIRQLLEDERVWASHCYKCWRDWAQSEGGYTMFEDNDRKAFFASR